MSEPLYCPVRRHYCKCHDWGDRCDVSDDEQVSVLEEMRRIWRAQDAMSNYHDFADSLRAIAPDLHEDWSWWQAEEREKMLEDALTACLEHGVPVEHLKTLARESGAVGWALKHSLKG